MAAGHRVAVASQFCFDATTLISWLERTRAAVSAAIAAAQGGFGGGEGEAGGGSVTYYVGVPGPTKPGKLERIAEICEVPSLFLGSAFDVLDLDGDGQVDESELLAAAATLGVDPAHLHEVFACPPPLHRCSLAAQPPLPRPLPPPFMLPFLVAPCLHWIIMASNIRHPTVSDAVLHPGPTPPP